MNEQWKAWKSQMNNYEYAKKNHIKVIDRRVDLIKSILSIIGILTLLLVSLVFVSGQNTFAFLRDEDGSFSLISISLELGEKTKTYIDNKIIELKGGERKADE